MNRALVELRFGQLVLDTECDEIGELFSVTYYEKQETLVLIKRNTDKDVIFKWIPISQVRYLAD